ncbi:MAG: 2-oxoacid:acceptor oxidoreductase family protein [Candidatus Verstraetearchaeota archaeon]|jgi:pyruvate ferredoxin oxidoreductase gamma subunit/2-oxoisovalerate ferredoxin oxidoreductase gamma subunit|nr:2-oxoacid:acceptor oxidoreductase family protein [Candidatus Verstraetearchaeota archaeon]
MLEIRWHGRGGQGVVTAAEILAIAAINEGKYAQAFAAFGPERRGAPVLGFTRIDDENILLRTQIYNPDIIVVLDSHICNMKGIEDGLKNDGIVILNTPLKPEYYAEKFKNAKKIATVDATTIAIKEIGSPITNTAILGAVIKTTNIVKLRSIELVIRERFRKEIAEKNIKAVREAFNQTIIFER